MIWITVSPNHPVTVIADDERRFHFGQVVGASKNTIVVRLRQTVRSIALLNARALIIETFGQISEIKLGTVTIELDCVNISSAHDYFLSLRIADAPALDIRITAEETGND